MNTFPASQNPDPPNPTDHWAVCQVFSKRATRIQSEAEGKGCGGFLPTYDFVRYSAGKRSSGTRQLLPGYLFVKVRPEDRAGIAELEGVYRILPGGTRALAQLEAEMARLVVGYVTRAWDEREAMPAEKRRRRRRRPRAGRRARQPHGAVLGAVGHTPSG